MNQKSYRYRFARWLFRMSMRLTGGALNKRAAYHKDEFESYLYSDHGIPRYENFDLYVKAYTTNPWINGAVKARADATASAPLKWYQTSRERNEATGVFEIVKEEVAPRGRNVVRLFQRPNPWMTSHDLWEWVTGFLLLDGNAYLHIDRKTWELWPLLPSRVRIKPHRTRYIDGYLYRVNARDYFIPADDVIHFKRFNPQRGYYGLSDIEALWFDLSIDSKLKRYLNTFFDHGARLSGVVELEDEGDEAEVARLEYQFNKQHGGSYDMHRVAFLPEKAKWRPTGQTNRDLQLGELSLLSRGSSMAIFRTPPAMLGIWDQARFSNAREQIRLFFEGVQVAFWRKLEQTINNHPISIDAGLISEFDVLAVPQLRESDNEKAERGRILIQSGQWTQNETRRLLWGLPPVEGHDLLITPKTGRNEDLGSNDPKDDDKKEKNKENEASLKDEDIDELELEEVKDLDGEIPLIRATMEKLEAQEVA